MAEAMLQQTQVARVVDRWTDFLTRQPSVEAAAATPRSEIIEQWQGLGYNRRAVNLHAAATEVVERFEGEIPCGLDDLLSLPGVGPYTARAVRVFAFELDDGVLDTNIGRVLSRWVGRPLRPTEAQDLADRLVPSGDSWRWNQAVMELGALICRPDPDCESCPVAADCAWNRAGRPEPDPRTGSAAVSGPQPRFEGSDRQGRGRLIDALRAGRVDRAKVASVMGWPDDPDRVTRVLSTLVRDGLVEVDADGVRLPS